MPIFSMFLHVFWAVSLNIKNDEEGHRASFLVFWAHSKAVPLNRGTGPFFLVFWAHSEAVSLNTKNGAEQHRALVKHRDARVGERHHLVGHQMNEQVRHRAVQALKVNRADTAQRHLGHALGGKAGNEAVAQVAHAADVDVAHRVVVGRRGSGSAPRLPSWGCEVPQAQDTASIIRVPLVLARPTTLSTGFPASNFSTFWGGDVKNVGR